MCSQLEAWFKLVRLSRSCYQWAASMFQPIIGLHASANQLVRKPLKHELALYSLVRHCWMSCSAYCAISFREGLLLQRSLYHLDTTQINSHSNPHSYKYNPSIRAHIRNSLSYLSFKNVNLDSWGLQEEEAKASALRVSHFWRPRLPHQSQRCVSRQYPGASSTLCWAWWQQCSRHANLVYIATAWDQKLHCPSLHHWREGQVLYKTLLWSLQMHRFVSSFPVLITLFLHFLKWGFGNGFGYILNPIYQKQERAYWF